MPSTSNHFIDITTTISGLNTTPAPDYDLSYFDDFDLDDLKKVRLHRQDDPRESQTARCRAWKLAAQPLVFGWSVFGASNTSASSVEGGRGLKFYYISNAAIFYRPVGADIYSDIEIAQRAAHSGKD